jgi:hypothetical protein
MANGTAGDRVRQSKPGRFSAVVGQMAALAGFMYCDGREAFARLSATTRADLHVLFDELNTELQQLAGKDARHG